MNTYEKNYFKKYIKPGEELKLVVHSHIINIFNTIFVGTILFAMIPGFFYHYSKTIHENILFWGFELYLLIVFLVLLYKIFDWYNNVLIVSDKTVYELDWSLSKKILHSIDFEKISLIEIEEHGQIDKMFKKGDLLLHRLEEETLVKRDLKPLIRLKSTPSPFKTADKIEEIINDLNLETEESEVKYDVIMDALGGVVENYLDKKGVPEKNEIDEELLEKIKNNEATIDLR